MKKLLIIAILALTFTGTIYSCTDTNDEAAYEINNDSPDPDEIKRPGGGS